MIVSVTKQYDPLTNTFSSYELVLQRNITKYVPLAEDNTDYQAIQEWISAGNTVIDNPPE